MTPAKESALREKTKQKVEFLFNASDHGSLGLGALVEDIAGFISADPARKYRVVIGTDSPGTKQVEFITAVVVHRVGKGGRYWWYRSPLQTMHSRRVRILGEVLQSIEVAEMLAPALRTHPLVANYFAPVGAQWQFGIPLEIHVDVGENGATKDMIQEVVGMVKGNGFEPKIKPDSFGASAIADRHT